MKSKRLGEFRLTTVGAIGAVAVAALVAGCGGGGSSGSSSGLKLSGTAATGTAVANKAVDARCATGTGTATTGADGSYAMTIADGVLPCVTRVTTADGVTLRSAATGSGKTATSNITPVTQLILSRLAGSPTAYDAGVNAEAVTALNSGLQAATDATVALLGRNGIDLSAAGNPISGALVAAGGSAAANAYGTALTTLDTRLASGNLTVDQFAAAVQQQTGATPSGTASLPAEVLLQPAAASCAWLRSGTYRVLVAETGTNPSAPKITVDVVANTIVSPSGSVSLQPAAGEPCRFATSGGADLTVSAAGVMTGRTGDNRLLIAFPEQSMATADLAGDWNMIGLDRENGVYSTNSGSYTIDAAGKFTAITHCADIVNCTTLPPPLPNITLSAHSDGGWTRANTSDGWSDRCFAYRAGGGEMIGACIDEGGTLGVTTRQRTLALPTVGTASSNWNVFTNMSLVAGNVSHAASTITSVDAATSSYTRDSVRTFGSPNVTQPEKVFVNNIGGATRNGYTWRQPGSVVDSSGATVTVSPYHSLSLRGMGMSALVLPGAAPRFGFSTARPN